MSPCQEWLRISYGGAGGDVTWRAKALSHMPGYMTRALTILGALLFCAASAAADDLRVVQQGEASVYSDKFQGKPTASGEPHDQNALTAASRSLPLGATATVTNLENGLSVEVEITDRGPFTRGRVIDLSRRAAASLGISGGSGTAPVRVEASADDQPTQELQDRVAALSARRAADVKITGQPRR